MDRTLIDKYESGGSLLKSAIAGLTPVELVWHPPADAGIGLWSIQQIVLHLMDSDLIWAGRMKTIIAEEDPIIIGFSESEFAARLFYDEQNATRAVEIFELNRRQVSAMLRKLEDAAFARTARHSHAGSITLAAAVQWMANHVEHHVKFIREKRRWREARGQ